MPQDANYKLRLSTVLEDRLRIEGNYVALAEAITAANTKKSAKNSGSDRRKLDQSSSSSRSTKDVIDRRKLKKIVKRDDKLVLSLDELKYLDRYLEPLGHGLAYISIFERPNVLESLADAGHGVTFLLGSKPDSAGRKRGQPFVPQLQLSHWDVKALAEIQRGVNNFAPEVRFDIRDVLLHDDVAGARRSVTKGSWVKLLDDDGTSAVCLGSGRANLAAEAMLCKMFGVPIFDSSKTTGRDLPFHFIWPEKRDHVFPSAFHRPPSDITEPAEAVRALRRGASALATVDNVFVDDLNPAPRGGVCYGLCAAQRRSRGQIWIVFAGVSGPATYAAAKLSGHLAFNLHARPTGANSPVIWAIVEAAVRRDRRRLAGAFLAVTDQAKVSGPWEWPPE